MIYYVKNPLIKRYCKNKTIVNNKTNQLTLTSFQKNHIYFCKKVLFKSVSMVKLKLEKKSHQI